MKPLPFVFLYVCSAFNFQLDSCRQQNEVHTILLHTWA